MWTNCWVNEFNLLNSIYVHLWDEVEKKNKRIEKKVSQTSKLCCAQVNRLAKFFMNLFIYSKVIYSFNYLFIYSSTASAKFFWFNEKMMEQKPKENNGRNELWQNINANIYPKNGFNMWCEWEKVCQCEYFSCAILAVWAQFFVCACMWELRPILEYIK